MAVSMETQRLISVSLGKIAQSRGQRGGINLHKNLLVATVLHKARTAYMIESYSYQQNLQRQKLLEQYQLQQQNLLTSSQKIDSLPLGESNKGEVCPLSRESNLGHHSTTPKGGELTRSEVLSESTSVSRVPESVSVQNNDEVIHGKENSPPSVEDSHILMENVPLSVTKPAVSNESHLTAATQLSQEAQLASSEHYSWKQQTLTSRGTTCNVLKRRRDNPTASIPDTDCPLSKIARVSYDAPVTPALHTDYSVDNSHESHSESEISHRSDAHQISSLVSIFNSGFSGLCVTSSSELHTSGYQSDFDFSSSHSRKITTKAG